MVKEVNTDNFDKEVRQSELPVIMDAYAPWCGPCRSMAPVFDEASVEMGELYKFVKMNVDEARDIAIEFGVLSVPTFLFLKEGKVVGQATGAMTKDKLKEKATEFFG